MTGKMITIRTPWDGTTAQIVLAPDLTAYDKERLIDRRCCMYSACGNGWTFLVVGKQKGYVRYAYCWRCMDLRLLREMLSGFDHKLQDRVWVIQNGKLKKAGSWLSDNTDLVQRYRARVIKESQERRPPKEAQLAKIRSKIVAELLGHQEWKKQLDRHTRVINDKISGPGIKNDAMIEAKACGGEIYKIDGRVDELLEQYKAVTEGHK